MEKFEKEVKVLNINIDKIIEQLYKRKVGGILEISNLKF